MQFSLLSNGKDQIEIKSICDSLGIRVIAYSPLGLGMLTGKYSPSDLPSGPRYRLSLLFMYFPDRLRSFFISVYI